jgi:outer membrane protein assembly factor BamB
MGAGTASAAVPAWTTYHHDAVRSGIDPDSSSPVAPSQVWQSAALDGTVFGEPLVYGSRVYVATENDTVYALDASSGQVVWQRHLGTPVSDSVIPCTGDINPTVGITSTPVIDPATGRIYVVADTWAGTAASVAHDMYGLNLSDGSIGVGPVPVDPAGSVHTDQLQRPALALDAGKVVIGYGGNSGDCGNYHGWLVAVPEAGGSLQSYEVDSQPGDSEGAIWGSGNAPPVDSSGDVWVSTGNGSSTNFDFSESVIKLDSNLNRLDYWAPSDWQSLDSGDADIGSSMPLLLPGNLVFQIGKSGTGYLLDASNLGGEGGSPVYSASVCNGSFGGGIFYNGVIYVACSDGMYALRLDTATRTFAPLPGWSVDSNAVSPPIEAGGLIWSADYQGSNLYGLDPSTGAETFVSDNLNGFEHFATPSAAGGLLYVANQTAGSGDQVTAFRVATTSPASPTSEALTTSANPSAIGQVVTFTDIVSPAPDAGTVTFTDGGVPIAGCGAIPVSLASSRVTCTTKFGGAGHYSIAASYSGDAYYKGSTAALTQGVTSTQVVPVISHLRKRLVRRRLRLLFTLSVPAKLRIVVWRRVSGRRVGHRCRAGAKTGRRCTILIWKGTFHPSGKQGRNVVKLRMRPLAPGSYTVTVIAISASGGRSRRHAITFTVARR